MEGGFNVVVFMTLQIVAAMLHGSSAQNTHRLNWVVPLAGEYSTWAKSTNFSVGDVLVFNFTSGSHDVAEVRGGAYDSCNGTNPITISTNGPTRINLTLAGEHQFICTFPGHCGLGQKLAINVSSAAPAPQPITPPPPATPSPATPPPAATPAPSPSRVGKTYIVGDILGWTVPPGGPTAYQTWAKAKRFMVEDILEFNFTSGQHNVIEVTKAEFDSCNISKTTTTPITTGPANITLTLAGEHHYICTFRQHCSLGQKLAINVTAGGSTVTPPSSSAPKPPPTPSTPSPVTAPPPSTNSAPSPVTAPPPPTNSAPSFAVAVLVPFTFVTVALAFLYN